MRHPALAVGILVSRYVVVIALAVLVTARPSAVSPSTRYRIIDLGAVTANRYSVASGVNDRGQVVGRRSPCELDRPCSSTAVLFEKGTMIDLVTPAGYETAAISASDINSRGQSVGCMFAFQRGELRAVVWEHGTGTQLGELTDAFAGCATGINDRGQIVGSTGHAVLWQDGTITDLGALPGDDQSAALAINNREQIVGYSGGGVGETWHAVLWDHGTITDLGTLTGPAGGGGLSQAWDINDRGQVVGSCSDEVLLGHGFLWEDGTLTDLGTLIGPAGSSAAAGINNRGQIVGYSDSVAGPTHAVLWEQGAITDLGTLIGPVGSSRAAGINNRGQIVGYSDSVAGPTHAVLWERGSAH